MAKRIFDVICSAIGLLLLAPVFVVVGLSIALDSPGPVFFRQRRIGRYGEPFLIHKFRTMRHDPEPRGLLITVGQDPRVTRVGAFLRRYKIDELPQLIDVLRGVMSLVGPRPEVPEYVAHYSDDDRQVVLSVRPGITDNASLEFSDESLLLAGAADPQRLYIEIILPKKVRLYRAYVQMRTMTGDVGIIFKTLRKIVRR